MPVVFIHGVATRKGNTYDRDVAVRDELIRRMLVEPLYPGQSGMAIVSPYWGDLAVRHYWAQATVPQVDLLEDLGASDAVTAADLEVGDLLTEMGETSLRSAWNKDPQRAVEALLAPIIHGEGSVLRPGDLPAGTTEHASGEVDGRVLVAGALVAADPSVDLAVRNAASEDDALAIITQEISTHAEQLGAATAQSGSNAATTEAGALESLGPAWFDTLRNRIGAVVDRAKNAPGRAATVAALDRYRDALHQNITLFTGDVFVYLLRRGEAGAPGPIVDLVVKAIAEAPRQRADEPLIVLTHSMGGNIFYDLLTTYQPTLKVDLWVSAGGQVGQFEEMKLFKASTRTDPPAPPMPPKVSALGGRVRTWLNVYDPADVLSFLVEPVFVDTDPGVHIRDLKFKSGVSALTAHGAYFRRATFYELLRNEIRGGP